MTKIYKMMFLMMLFLSTLISISSYSWFGMWLGLEINMLSIIPLMNNNNVLSSESSVKYFITQSVASTIFLFSALLMMTKTSMMSNMNFESTFVLMMNSSLLTKMGMAPFHFWFPEVMEGLSWPNCLLILTWQKVAPMILLMYNMKFTMFMSTIIMLAMIISGLMGINQISLRKIMAYSSINHMGWMISAMMIMETIWFYYFIIYSIISINMILILNKFKIFFLNQLYHSMNYNPMTKMLFILNFLSLSGIPPLLGFLPKWLTIQALVSNNLILLPTLMIVTTMITIYMYMRITLSTFLMNTNEPNWNIKSMSIKFESMTMSIINFATLGSLIIITILFNML